MKRPCAVSVCTLKTFGGRPPCNTSQTWRSSSIVTLSLAERGTGGYGSRSKRIGIDQANWSTASSCELRNTSCRHKESLCLLAQVSRSGAFTWTGGSRASGSLAGRLRGQGWDERCYTLQL